MTLDKIADMIERERLTRELMEEGKKAYETLKDIRPDKMMGYDKQLWIKWYIQARIGYDDES